MLLAQCHNFVDRQTVEITSSLLLLIFFKCVTANDPFVNGYLSHPVHFRLPRESNSKAESFSSVIESRTDEPADIVYTRFQPDLPSPTRSSPLFEFSKQFLTTYALDGHQSSLPEKVTKSSTIKRIQENSDLPQIQDDRWSWPQSTIQNNKPLDQVIHNPPRSFFNKNFNRDCLYI